IGSSGGTYATPIINHPEVMILGMYKIVERPVFRNGAFVPVHMMNLTVTADHRLIDGAVAARFLSSFIQKLESPGMLMMEMS
ncbi:MAG: 2-oxo acid dehydrogenase subunit E2, partial [Bdellovibrionia bacterium]